MPSNPTPSFKRPPVIERLLGVQFAPLDKWVAPMFGLFWEQVRTEFPKIEVHPPIAPTPEGPARIEVDFGAGNIRCWFMSEEGDSLIQVQNDRFLMNWRKIPDTDYKRYSDHLRSKFVENWDCFLSFVRNEKMGDLSVVQCEVTYINHIAQGDGWDKVADWHKVFTVCNKLSDDGFLPAPESRGFAFNYPMPQGGGSLRVKVSRAMRLTDRKDVIQFELTARGRPESNSTTAIMEWMDRAHDWVVGGFTELTTKSMHDEWERAS